MPGPDEPPWLRGCDGDGDIRSLRDGDGWVCDGIDLGCRRGDGVQGREGWSGGFGLCGSGMCECDGVFVVASVVRESPKVQQIQGSSNIPEILRLPSRLIGKVMTSGECWVMRIQYER